MRGVTARRAALSAVATVVTVVLMASALFASLASAATGDVGVLGPSTVGAGAAPTGEKPESKLWWHDGRWWTPMFHSASRTWRIHYLDRPAQAWMDTGTVVDSRTNSRADTLADGSQLYIASHATASSSASNTKGSPALLTRYTYDPAQRRYALDPGFPTAINDVSSETLTIDKDGAGRLWATWTQAQSVYVAASTTSGETWHSPSVLPVAGATGLDADDISTITTFAGQTGIMWSSQSDSAVYFVSRDDGAPLDIWGARTTVTLPGPNQADDHLNVKTLQSDDSGRVYAVLKTSLDASKDSKAPQIVVLARDPNSKAWSRATFGTVSDCHTRPVLVLDSANQMVHVYATAPDSGCPFSGSAGTIFRKSSPMGSLSFAAGRGTPVMRDSASPNLNNVTAAKQTVDSRSGVVLLASNDSTRRYWFSDTLAGQPETSAPVAGFSVSSTSGVAPLAVSFTDSSTGSPSSWAWDFGDGGTSTAQHPTHTYSVPGTYSVQLTASNASGSSTRTATGLVTVDEPPPPTAPAVSVVGGASSSATTARADVTLARPAGLADGDVVIAQINADLRPSMKQVPAGWTSVLPSNLPISTGATVFAYYRVVTNAATEPTTWTWELSAPQKWGAGVTAYRGVDTTTVFDGPAVTRTDTTYKATTITLPAITTTRPGAMLVSAIGTDAMTVGTTLTPGWTSRFQEAGGQYAELADQTLPTAGTTDTTTWTLNPARAATAWARPLRPAG